MDLSSSQIKNGKVQNAFLRSSHFQHKELFATGKCCNFLDRSPVNTSALGRIGLSWKQNPYKEIVSIRNDRSLSAMRLDDLQLTGFSCVVLTCDANPTVNKFIKVAVLIKSTLRWVFRCHGMHPAHNADYRFVRKRVTLISIAVQKWNTAV